jgi:acyl transferase domain-containing protein/acyl carrier protein
MLSPDGHCKAFDAAADGFVRGEGCGIVVLKLLSEARAAGDRVLAVIRGSAVNQDGRSAGLTAPNGPAQEAVIRAALANAGLQPDAVDYIEAHGTGTALGDPIEMHALAAVFGGRRRDLPVGSVKTNIGHAEAAAGIAGLIKAVLMLRHQAIPANLHFRRLNPHIDLGGVPITVPAGLTPRALRYAGVSSFGFSGTNAHVVLEHADGGVPEHADSVVLEHADGGVPERADSVVPEHADAAPLPGPEPAAVPRLFVSARTPRALSDLIARYRDLLATGVAFADVCHSASAGRARLPWWVCAANPEDLATPEPSNAAPPDLPPQPGRRIDLPLYPFQRQPYWASPRRTAPAARGAHALLGRRLRSGLAQIQYEAVLAPDQPAWLADHAVNGHVVVPAAALIEMMLAVSPVEGGIELTGIAFRRMLVPADQPLVQTVADPATGRLTIFAAADTDDAAFTLVATADWRVAGDVPDAALEAARGAAVRLVDLATLYARFAAAGLVYGPAFRTMTHLFGGDGIALAELAASDPGFRLDPRVLDAAWQSLAAALPPDSTRALVPVGLDRLIWRGGTPCTSVLRLTAPDLADVALLDSGGNVVAWCEGLRLAAADDIGAVTRETTWEAIPSGDEDPVWLDCRGEADPAAACWRVLEAYRAAEDDSRRLAVLARGATAAGGSVPHPAQAALVGLLSTLGRERPELRPLLLDLDQTALPPPVPAVCGPLLAWRDGELLAPRLVAQSAPAAPAAPFRLAHNPSGTLDGLHWEPAIRQRPGPNEVEVEIATAGINFRDVMNLLGVYPGDGGAPGVECAGLVSAIGPGVTSVAVGDTVVAIAPGCFASHVIADARLVCRLPVGLSPAAAAAQPVALLTARLALEDTARLQPGQRVLIHAATGGVGLAAVILAQLLGARIVATAGNPAKRSRLAELGVREVYDSRTLDFASAAPVHVVLNSLTGAAIPAGLRLLQPGGIFLELGKAEVWTPAQVRAVRPDVRYTVIGLDQVILDEPARVGAMLREAIAALSGGAEALPVQTYAFADVTGALRCLQAARHIGKLALTRMLFRGDACYVISGGTGALGRHLAAWLVARGARHLVLLSRQPVAVEIPGATVRSVAVDVADRLALERALGGLSLPVKGVFHLAAALHDATAARLSREGLEAALAAKLLGATALDEVTAALSLDHFVLFGSLASVVGSAGQANYAAANSALDALVRARRARGAPALLVDWGAWQGGGMARGLDGPALPPDMALAALDAAMSRGMTRVAVSAGAAPTPPVIPGLAKRLAEAIGTARLDVLTEAVDEIVARILGLGGIALERERPLNELGLDSLMAVELRNALSAAIGRTLPASLVFDHPTAEALSVFLAGELGLVAARMPAAPPPPIPIAAVDDGEMDDDAALLLLERKLSHAGY